MDDVAILARAWPVDVPLRVWLHLNCTLFLPLYSECAPPPAHRPPPPLMKIYRWRASFLVLLDHSLHCDRPPPPFVPRFFSSSGATRRGKGTGEIGVCFFLGDVLSRMANPEENGGKKVLKCRGLKTRLPTYILIFLYLKFNSYI